MNASDLLAEFARRANVTGLSFNESGLARLEVDGDVTIDLEYDSAARELHLYCTMGRSPADGREAFYERLLGLNLFCRRTLGATLAIDAAAGEVLLCRALQLDGIDYTAFETAMTRLVDAAQSIRSELGNVVFGAKPLAAADELPVWSIRA